MTTTPVRPFLAAVLLLAGVSAVVAAWVGAGVASVRVAP